jgi:methylenetetrahydrofolate reductase (NADPH)
MKITEAFAKGSPTLSFEFFPPKTPKQEARLFEVIGRLKKFNPDFVSVTYGAMGTTRAKTFFWVNEIKTKYGIEPVAHLTCVAATRNDIGEQLDELEKMGVKNILALRGDPPEGQAEFISDFKLARELIAFIKDRKPSFCLGCAGFPEGHPRAASLEQDIEFLRQKIDAGAEYVITQLFFDNRYYFDFVKRCGKAGIKVPIIPGLMPITNLNQIKKMTDVCGATIPGKLREKLEKHPADTPKIGAEQALAQTRELIKAGVPGLHFFVMNQAEPISTILMQVF